MPESTAKRDECYYAYRVFPAHRIEDRLNEARNRGWSLHTFCDAIEDSWASAVFQWVGVGEKVSPFKDDDD